MLGYEIAHVLAHHREARISAFGLAALTTITALPFILGALVVGELYVLAAPPIAVGALVLLALSRGQETEADDMGMLLMTEAGFDPTAAESFWTKMAKVEQEVREARGGKEVVEYKSTHPHVSVGVLLSWNYTSNRLWRLACI